MRHCEERSNLLFNYEIATVYKKINFAMTIIKRYSVKRDLFRERPNKKVLKKEDHS